MAPRSSRSQRAIGEMVDVAVRHYELGEPTDALAADRGVDQSTIRRWLGRTRREGVVQTLVVRP